MDYIQAKHALDEICQRGGSGDERGVKALQFINKLHASAFLISRSIPVLKLMKNIWQRLKHSISYPTDFDFRKILFLK